MNNIKRTVCRFSNISYHLIIHTIPSLLSFHKCVSLPLDVSRGQETKHSASMILKNDHFLSLVWCGVCLFFILQEHRKGFDLFYYFSTHHHYLPCEKPIIITYYICHHIQCRCLSIFYDPLLFFHSSTFLSTLPVTKVLNCFCRYFQICSSVSNLSSTKRAFQLLLN